jgi:uncharacterized protein YabN with tetrapyrrole methylase and pyrophosphatase domain
MLEETFNKINKNNSIIENCQKTQLYVKEKYSFGYNTIDEILIDLNDELNEMYEEIKKGNTRNIELEMGDVIFVLCNLANKYNRLV